MSSNILLTLLLITVLTRGWENGKLPVNEAFLKEYLKSAAALKKLDTLNITGSLKQLNN
jgi:hypothetical protein